MTRVPDPLFATSARPAPLALPAQDLLRDAVTALQARRVECGASDFTSLARGKLVHAQDFIGQRGCKLPSVVLGLTLTAGEPEAVFGPLLPTSYADVHLVPDLATLAARPGRPGEATVICEPAGLLQRADGGVLEVAQLSPRAALRAVLARLADDGLQPLVAPELELFLLQREGAGLLAARAHAGSHAREEACEAYSLERSGHFQAYFDALFAACEGLRIPVSGHAHESALSQYEVNFHPGPALAQADAVFRFKRLAREVAVQQGFLASFAAKPFLDQPGTGMHWHASLQRGAGEAGWPHVFALADGRDSAALGHFVAGQQAEAAATMAFYAPYDMSYDRIRLSDAAPTHASWGHEARSLAFRVPASGPSARRVENRLPGGDANPYLTLAATLGLGGQGLRAARAPQDSAAAALPASLPEALAALRASQALRTLLGDALVDAYVGIKQHEHAERQALADPRAQWDLRHLIELA
jgi:glutamine synthetase